ncbi:hypothetical protein [Streptomyces sp. NPDC058694]|uniref:hypothetical protein n=1 Tax=Streptomyces sp. NPDC058694 TaxID=3346603 RepID=UPI00364B2926
MGWITAGWLLGFAGFNAGLGVARWRRTRAERHFVRGARRSVVDPIQAGWWLGASWKGASAQQERYAAEVAVRLLVLTGQAQVDGSGRISAAPGQHSAPEDPALATLAAGLRPADGVTVHELLTEPRFARRPPDESTDHTGRGDPAELPNDAPDLDVDHGSGFGGGD